MSLVWVPCPSCGSSSFELVYRGSLDPAEDPASYFSSSRTNVAYPDIVRCNRCDLLMANPRDDEATLARVYAGLSDHHYDNEDANRSQAAKRHCEIVRRELAPPARLLDVGCASGFFVGATDRAGYDVVGADASTWMIERARERCPRCEFRVGALESLSYSAEFDAVTLWDVLEHVHSPSEVLTRAWEWLKPGGLLLMSLPNAGSLCAKVLGPKWVLLLREHLWYFSPKTIAPLLEKTGFELVKTRTKWVRFSLSNIAHRLATYEGITGPLMQRLSSASVSRHLSMTFPMGEMYVTARKLPK